MTKSFKPLLELFATLSSKSDLSQFRSEYRDIVRRLPDACRVFLTRVQDTLVDWGSRIDHDPQAVLEQWRAIDDDEFDHLPAALQMLLFRFMPKSKLTLDQWRGFLVECRNTKLIEALLKLRMIGKKDLRAWMASELESFSQSAALDFAVREHLLKPSGKLWLEIAELKARSVPLISRNELLVSIYERWKESHADRALTALLSTDSDEASTALLSVLLDYPLSAARFVRFLASELGRQNSADSAFERVTNLFAQLCVDTLTGTNDASHLERAATAFGLLRLTYDLARLKSGKPELNSSVELTLRKSAAAIANFSARRMEENPAAPQSSAFLTLRGGELAVVLRGHMESMPSAQTSYEDVSDGKTQYQRYLGQRDILNDLVNLLDEAEEGVDLRVDLEVLLINSGVSPIGESGVLAKFDPRIHRSITSGVLPGDEVEIVRTGHQFGFEAEAIVLSKAVTKASQATQTILDESNQSGE